MKNKKKYLLKKRDKIDKAFQDRKEKKVLLKGINDLAQEIKVIREKRIEEA